MHDSLFAKQTALSPPALLDRAKTLGLDTAKFTECQSSAKYPADIQRNLSEAQKMGIDGTPTFYLGAIEPNGDVTIHKQVQGNAPFDVFKTELDTLIAFQNTEVAIDVLSATPEPEERLPLAGSVKGAPVVEVKP